jgi:hypothetical protein
MEINKCENCTVSKNMFFFLALITGILIAALYEDVLPRITRKKSLVIYGHLLHHSIYGVVFVLLGLALKNISAMGFGVGILIQHTVTDGFRFISRR